MVCLGKGPFPENTVLYPLISCKSEDQRIFPPTRLQHFIIIDMYLKHTKITNRHGIRTPNMDIKFVIFCKLHKRFSRESGLTDPNSTSNRHCLLLTCIKGYGPPSFTLPCLLSTLPCNISKTSIRTLDF